MYHKIERKGAKAHSFFRAQLSLNTCSGECRDKNLTIFEHLKYYASLLVNSPKV